MLSTVSIPTRSTGAPRGTAGAEAPSQAARRLLEAAAEAFADRGFHATTTRDIAAKAGLSPAGVYVHFASKEDLLYALSRQGHESARDLLVAAASQGTSPTQSLE